MARNFDAEIAKIAEISDDDYVSLLWEKYKFPKSGVDLNSNVNVYESGFIIQLIADYIKNIDKNSTIRVFEIGLAYGTSTISAMSALAKCANPVIYDSVDIEQTKYWKGIGMSHIADYLQHNKNITHNLTQQSSTVVMPTIKEKYDIIIIDGSHATDMVLQDLRNGDRMLKPGGLMILDDVIHPGVKNAMVIINREWGVPSGRQYEIVKIANGHTVRGGKMYASRAKRSFDDPSTMYCLRKRPIRGGDGCARKDQSICIALMCIALVICIAAVTMPSICRGIKCIKRTIMARVSMGQCPR